MTSVLLCVVPLNLLYITCTGATSELVSLPQQYFLFRDETYTQLTSTPNGCMRLLVHFSERISPSYQTTPVHLLISSSQLIQASPRGDTYWWGWRHTQHDQTQGEHAPGAAWHRQDPLGKVEDSDALKRTECAILKLQLACAT